MVTGKLVRIIIIYSANCGEVMQYPAQNIILVCLYYVLSTISNRTEVVLMTFSGCKEVTSLSSLSLANVSQYLLISRASVTELHQHILESSDKVCNVVMFKNW